MPMTLIEAGIKLTVAGHLCTQHITVTQSYSWVGPSRQRGVREVQVQHVAGEDRGAGAQAWGEGEEDSALLRGSTAPLPLCWVSLRLRRNSALPGCSDSPGWTIGRTWNSLGTLQFPAVVCTPSFHFEVRFLCPVQ